MNIEEIRKGAPEGATHYYFLMNGSVLFYARKSKYLWFFDRYDYWMNGIEVWSGMIKQHISKLKPL